MTHSYNKTNSYEQNRYKGIKITKPNPRVNPVKSTHKNDPMYVKQKM